MRILRCLEDDEVRPKHTVEELRSSRKTAEHLRGRKGGMKEKADAGFWELPADQFRHKQQVIVVNPNCVAILVAFKDPFRKCFIDLDVVLPRMILERLALGMVGHLIVEDWPENGMAVVGIVTIEVTVLRPHWQCIVLVVQLVIDLTSAILSHLISREADCADPGNMLEIPIV